MSKEIANGTALGLEYHVYTRTGTVEGSDTRAETEVSGQISGGGGASYGGTGYNAPVSGSVQSKTTRYQNIFLKDDDGVEHTIELVNFLVPCKEGQKLTLYLITPGRKDAGSYFSAYNHNSRQKYDHVKAIRTEMYPRLTVGVAIALCALYAFMSGMSGVEGSFGNGVFAAVMGGLLAAAFFGGIGFFVSVARSMAVRRNTSLRGALSNPDAALAGT
ncbi:MAG: hypothetical protein U5K76_03420 [Woeseiaceae bacterium]|nr:hypothetical protein [Woeseiaceae bacterium]